MPKTVNAVVQLLSHVQLFATLQTAACQSSLSFSISWSLLKLCPLSWWCHPSVTFSVATFSSCLQSFPASGLFQWVSSSHKVAKILELQLQHQHQSFQWIFRVDFLYWLLWSLCCPRDSQESSPAPQFENIDFVALSFLYGPTLTTIDDYRKTTALTMWTFVS